VNPLAISLLGLILLVLGIFFAEGNTTVIVLGIVGIILGTLTYLIRRSTKGRQ
jgi:hypothetical protein